mgnify:FL=1
MLLSLVTACSGLGHTHRLLSPQPRMLADTAADVCLLPTESDADAPAVDAIANDNRFRIGLTLVPVLAPLVAFGTYDLVFAAFHELKTALRSWYAVDGGSLERELLIPVVNGVVNPAISIVLATLVAGTINSLRQRQIQIRTLLNQEACDARLLEVALESVYRDSPDERRASLSILQQYVTRIIVESRSAAGARVSPTSESELDGLVRILAQDVSGGNNGGRFYEPFLFSMTGIVQSLNNARSARLAALQTNYPVVHWVILALLQMSVLTNFLIESVRRSPTCRPSRQGNLPPDPRLAARRTKPLSNSWIAFSCTCYSPSSQERALQWLRSASISVSRSQVRLSTDWISRHPQKS